ncbi:MAG: hypothetical protein OHK0047_45200 [Leptolyngbyaceae cyanobacterium]
MIFLSLSSYVAEDYFDGSARKTETVLGWNRASVQLGLHERRSGITCVDNYRARGRHKSKVVLVNLEADIASLVDRQAQADPKFQSTFYLLVSVPKPSEKLGVSRRATMGQSLINQLT